MAWLEAIFADLRPGDLAEMQATNPLPQGVPFAPFLLLLISFQQTEEVVVICDRGEPVCVFGQASVGDGE